ELFVENPYLRTLGGLKVVLTRELFVAIAEPRLVPYYRPVSGLLYWITYQLFGTNALLQHVFNTALHGGCAVLFFFLVRELTKKPRVALFAAVIAATHPITTELVAYMGGRQDIIGWSFTFGALLILLRTRVVWRTFVVTFVATLLAALTREFFLAVPVLHVIGAAAAPARPRSRNIGAA